MSGHFQAQKKSPEQPSISTHQACSTISCCTSSTHHLEQILIAYEPSNCPTWAATCPLKRSGKRMASGSTCTCSKCIHKMSQNTKIRLDQPGLQDIALSYCTSSATSCWLLLAFRSVSKKNILESPGRPLPESRICTTKESPKYTSTSLAHHKVSLFV